MSQLIADPSFPLVSIVTTTYNSGKTVNDTLQSVASQDYPNIEHIIIDGASTDNTLEIVRRFPHVQKIISEKDKGIYDAMNKGLKATSGQIIGFLNSDDFYISNSVVREVIELMQTHKTDALYADLVYVHPVKIDKVLRTWVAGSFKPRKFLFGWMPPHPTFFVRKNIYDQWGMFNTDLRTSADYELMLRLLYKHKISVCYLPKVIIKMRSGGVSNASLTNRLKANKEDREAWRINQLEPNLFTSWLKPLRKISQFIFYEKNSIR